MKLSAFAKKLGISWKTAFRMFRRGEIEGAYQLPTGTIIVPEPKPTKAEYVVVYARESSADRKQCLETQAERCAAFCSAKGWAVAEIVKECASGLNDKRPKLQKILKDQKATKLVVEHKDRLTRFGFEYIKTLFDGEIIVINPAEDKDDLMHDFVSLVTCFCARLYGQRRTKRNTEKLIKSLQHEDQA